MAKDRQYADTLESLEDFIDLALRRRIE